MLHVCWLVQSQLHYMYVYNIIYRHNIYIIYIIIYIYIYICIYIYYYVISTTICVFKARFVKIHVLFTRFCSSTIHVDNILNWSLVCTCLHYICTTACNEVYMHIYILYIHMCVLEFDCDYLYNWLWINSNHLQPTNSMHSWLFTKWCIVGWHHVFYSSFVLLRICVISSVHILCVRYPCWLRMIIGGYVTYWGILFWSNQYFTEWRCEFAGGSDWFLLGCTQIEPWKIWDRFILCCCGTVVHQLSQINRKKPAIFGRSFHQPFISIAHRIHVCYIW